MNKSTTNLAIVLAVVALFPAQLRAETTPELRKAMRERLEAVWKKDAVAWSRLTADEFTVVVPDGTLMNKAERILALKFEPPEPSHALRNETTHMYGDT